MNTTGPTTTAEQTPEQLTMGLKSLAIAHKNGKTPIGVASAGGHVELVTMMLQAYSFSNIGYIHQNLVN